MAGQIGILNVGAGDTKLVFDRSNPAECIRAARIVKDMLRRGYALLIEVPKSGGGRVTQRVYDFDESACEYIIADFDPTAGDATAPNNRGLDDGPSIKNEEGSTTPAAATPVVKRGRKPKRKGIAADAVDGIAVARSAGG